jgi:hypothetical protein
MQIDPESFGKAMGDTIRAATAPLMERIKALESREPVQGPKGEDGKDGKDGKDGRDAADLTQEDVLSALKSAPSFMRDVLADYFKEFPPPAGPKGERGEPGPAGPEGARGADGVGLAGFVINRDGELIATDSKGAAHNLGKIVGNDGTPGRDGKDGADLSDVDFEFDGERTVTVKAKGGQIVKSYTMPVPIYRGYWRDGMACEKGDAVTDGGSTWIAMRATKAKPCHESPDWNMAVRKGKDGRDGRDGIDKVSPVDLIKPELKP